MFSDVPDAATSIVQLPVPVALKVSVSASTGVPEGAQQACVLNLPSQPMALLDHTRAVAQAEELAANRTKTPARRVRPRLTSSLRPRGERASGPRTHVSCWKYRGSQDPPK